MIVPFCTSRVMLMLISFLAIACLGMKALGKIYEY